MNNGKSNRVIVGIGHKARQGKDTAAEYLEEKYRCRIIHFADALYDECQKGKLFYNAGNNTCYLKPEGEDYFAYENPPENFVQWFRDNGKKGHDLPFDADLYFDGMKVKDGNLLQFWGTEFRRKQFDWDYWVDKVRAVIKKFPDDDFMVPDTRFKNEAKMLQELGGVIWKVVRPGFVASDRDPNHPSEIDLNDWNFDLTLVNDGNIDALRKKAETHYRKLKGLPDVSQ